MKLSKTDFLIYKDCGKNAWIKIHKPEIYRAKPLSQFEQSLFETGREVDNMARLLFPGGISVARGNIQKTSELINAKTPVIYQAYFETDKFTMSPDIMVWNENAGAYDLYEVKSSTSGGNTKSKDEEYSFDISFQVNVLEELNIPINNIYLVRLNSDYVRGTELDINQLFTKENFNEEVGAIKMICKMEMDEAYKILTSEKEPPGNCKCILRGRSGHCTTFSYSNPEIPEYSIHDITRIGMSKKKLAELVDSKIFDILEVPDDFPLTDPQKNQVRLAKLQKEIFVDEEITEFMSKIQYPISFLDYETFAAGIPRFQGYKPFDQIPFQFSLHVLDLPIKETQTNSKENLKHYEFIFTENENPDIAFIKALENNLPANGSIIVWNKTFEIGRNKDLARRNPAYQKFIENINDRIIDLRDIFTAQHFVHPDFKGKTSIKYVLPVLVPELSYKNLEVKEGATASDTWNKIVLKDYDSNESFEKIKALLEYCKLDTYAMFAIWEYIEKRLKE